jgi:DNA-binding winged helix-turn-helix (wHTH) protein
MRDIFRCGSQQSLIDTMKGQGYKVTKVIVSDDWEEQTWHFLLDDTHYNYKAEVVVQVNEYDDDLVAIALNVIKVNSELI